MLKGNGSASLARVHRLAALVTSWRRGFLIFVKQYKHDKDVIVCRPDKKNPPPQHPLRIKGGAKPMEPARGFVTEDN